LEQYGRKIYINMPPKRFVDQLKARIEFQRQLEEKAKYEVEEEEKKLQNEIRLAKEQELIEAEERSKVNEVKREKTKDRKTIEDSKRRLEIIEQMRLSGMVMPEGYEKSQENNIKVAIQVRKEKQEEKEVIVDINSSRYRSIICAYFGHVDSGKTSLLDCIRGTNVQKHEHRGITQTMSSTFLSHDVLVEKCSNFYKDLNITIPGILSIDLPGHAEFGNMKNRAGSMCDIALVIIDITHGLELETKNAIELLKKKKCMFIVVLNKVDRLYGWEAHINLEIEKSLALQKKFIVMNYETCIQKILLQLAEQGINAELFYKNNNHEEYVSVVPVSAVTGEGINDLIALQIYLAQKYMIDKIIFKSELECTTFEVKPIENIGMAVDAILINGILCVGDQIAMCGIHGPVITKIKRLLIPQNGDYVNTRTVKGSMCIKIIADDLEKCIPGSRLVMAENVEIINGDMDEIKSVLSKVSKDNNGVSIHASSLGSIEAILLALEKEKIAVNYIGLGSLCKKNMAHVLKTKEKNPKFGVILAFDVEITDEAKTFADKEKIKICSSNVIYTLIDQFKKHIDDYDQMRKEINKNIAVFPVSMKVIAVFRNKSPMIIGCRIEKGILKLGTPICIRDNENMLEIGNVVSLQKDKKELTQAKEGDEIAIAIQCAQNNISFGRTIDTNTILCSKISRQSIDALKESYRDQMSMDDWKLIVDLKKESGFA
jgi:translation initiation factor 5B